MSLIIGGLFGRPGGRGRGSGIILVAVLPTGNDIVVDGFYVRTTDGTMWYGVADAMGNRSLDAVNSNFRFGTPPVIVADDAARDLYFTTNSGELTQYDNDPNLFIAVGTGFQHRVNSAWVSAGAILKGDRGQKGDKGDESRYPVADANVSQTLTEITLTIPNYTSYSFGDQVIFRVPSATTAANPTIQINSLGFKPLLKNDGTAIQTLELRQNLRITATYNGTAFVSDLKEEPHFHYVVPANVTVSSNGNAYSITDSNIVGQGIVPPSMIGFEAKADNTGDVTLSVNGSTAVSMRLSDGSEIPAGVLKDNQYMLLAFEAGHGWNIVNLQPARGSKGALIASYTVPTGNYTDGRQPLPGGLVLANANANIWIDYSSALYEGVLDADPTKILYGEGWNFYFNSVNEVWRRPVGATFADGVWDDVVDADIPDMLDWNYPSDTMDYEWLGVVADEAAANAAVTDVDDLTVRPAAYFGGAVKHLSGKSNAAGYAVLDVGREDIDRRSEIEFPDVNSNENITGAVVEVLYNGSVVGRRYMLDGSFGFSRVNVDLDDGTSMGLSGEGFSNYLTIYLHAGRNNANVGASDNVQLNVYEWG